MPSLDQLEAFVAAAERGSFSAAARQLGKVHEAVLLEKLNSGELVALELDYQQSGALQGLDVVWTENRPLGIAGLWLLEQLHALDIGESR